jgi:alkanesulfonate monooxygenase SsuD/methylene tetrahydromethanopterin reductase-like flavin-dependent oxidoreductase (luciferase family)
VRFGVNAPNTASPRELIDLAATTEAAGWDGFFLWDHLHLVRDLHLPIVDPWVTLGAAAIATARVRLGTLITPLARRRPQKLAKELTTLDHLSGGRAVLGVGLGEPRDADFEVFGDPGDPKVRGEILDESLAVLDGLMTGEPFTYAGEHRVADADFRPPPVQQPRPPIWVGAVWPNRRPLARAARYEGVVPLDVGAQGCSPDLLKRVLDIIQPDPGFEVVATIFPGQKVSEYEAAGATWIITSRWPEPGWLADLRTEVAAGPPG